jgi:Mg2+/Co2+ transporter CorB
VSGNATIRDINRKLDIHLPVGGAKTLGGLILEQLQAMPEEKTLFELRTDTTESSESQKHSVKMEIEAAEDNVIQSVKIFT